MEIFCFFILGATVYFNSLWSGFIWDDYALVVNNSLIKDPSRILQVFTSNLAANRSIFYRPLQNISYLIDFLIFKLNPAGFHLTNIILHILAAILFYKLLFLLTKNKRLGLFSSLLYLVCPLWVESVAYISGRADSLMAIFIFSSFIFFIKENYLPALIFYLAALFSKEASLIYPLILLSYCLIFKKTGRAQLVSILLAFSLSAFYAFAAFYSKGASAILPQSLLLNQRLLFLPKAVAQYIGLIFLPLNLHMSYTVALPRTIGEAGVILSILFCIFLILLFFYFLRREKFVSFFLSWFFIILLPYSGIFAINAFFAEHFIYLAAPGIFAVFVYFLERLKPVFLGRAIIFSYLAIFSVATIRYNAVWQDPVKFYSRIISLSQNSFAVYNNLGVVLLERGDIAGARKNFTAALRIDPEFPDAKLNLARCFYLENDLARAIGIAKSVSEQNPKNFLSLNFLGTFYLKRGDFVLAQESYKRAIALNPDYAPFYKDLYSLYKLQGRVPEAEKIKERIGAIDKYALADIYYADAQESFSKDNLSRAQSAIEQAIRLNPGNSGYANFKGHLLRKQGDLAGAFLQFKKAIGLSAQNYEAYNNLGNLFAQAGDFESAQKDFKKAIALKADFTDAYFNLGLLYFEKGRFNQARESFRRALSLNASHALAKEYLAKIK